MYLITFIICAILFVPLTVAGLYLRRSAQGTATLGNIIAILKPYRCQFRRSRWHYSIFP